jgi:hypothetical protein
MKKPQLPFSTKSLAIAVSLTLLALGAVCGAQGTFGARIFVAMPQAGNPKPEPLKASPPAKAKWGGQGRLRQAQGDGLVLAQKFAYLRSAMKAELKVQMAIKNGTLTFSPAAGTYTTNQSVTISCATSGATIYYTTNGSTPTASLAA